MILKDTDAWDYKWSLPTFGGQNPHAFTAYCLKAMDLVGEDDAYVRENYSRFSKNCQKDAIKGLYMRYPDGGGGPTSWDEILGMSWISPDLAKDIYQYLEITDGIYDDENPGAPHEGRNVYRFPYMRPLLRTLSGLKNSLIDDAILSLWILYDAVNPDKGMSGHLQLWLIRENLDSILCKTTYFIWGFILKKKGISTYSMLTTYFGNKPKFIEWLKPVAYL